MKKDAWVWWLADDADGWHAELMRISFPDEILSWLAGYLIRHGLTYRLGNRVINRVISRSETLLILPLTEGQAERLGVEW